MSKKKKENKNSSVVLEEEKLDEKALEEDIEQSINIVNKNREELDNQRNDRLNNKFKRTADGKLINIPKITYNFNITTILCILAFIIAITWILYEYGPIFGVHISSSQVTQKNMIELVTTDSDIYGEYNDEVYVFSNNTITTYNENCEKTWEYSFSQSFLPTIVTDGRYMLVTNDSTGMLYLFNNQNLILTKQIDGEIKNTFLDKYGNIAIVYSVSTGYNNVVSVYDKKGNDKYDVYLTQNAVVSLKLLNNAQKIVFAESVTESSTIGIKFRIIDISKNEEEQLLDIVNLEDQFVFDFIVQGKKIYALLDDKIVCIDINTSDVTTLKEFDSAQMLFVALNDNYYTYVERDSENYVVNSYTYEGTVISTEELDSVPYEMLSTKYVNYYIYQDYVYILNKWGVEIGNVDISFTPKQCIAFNDNKSLALIYTNKIYVINL